MEDMEEAVRSMKDDSSLETEIFPYFDNHPPDVISSVNRSLLDHSSSSSLLPTTI